MPSIHRASTCILIASCLLLQSGLQAQSDPPPPDPLGAELLMPFSQLRSTPAGQQALIDNIFTALDIQNNADSATRDQAIRDATTDFDYASSMATGLGEAYSQRYFDALYSANPLILNGSPIHSLISGTQESTDLAAGFAKDFFGSGETQGLSITFPTGGIPNVYGEEYIPGLNVNPSGDPRPFQVAPLIGANIVTFSGDTFVPPRPDVVPNTTVGPDMSNVQLNSGLVTSAAFPSGHSTYAYTSAIVFGMMVPEKYQTMMGRATEFANHRVVMGAHYPLDVMGGRTVATYIMAQSLQDPNNLTFLENTAIQFRKLVGAGEGVNILERGLTPSELDAFRADYLYHMTYDLTPTHATDLPAVAPEGSEVLLATRFPYLAETQLNEVLRTTMIESGAALDNTDPEFAGWYRLNLFDAVGGYGALDADTTVVMDAAQGGFSAVDEWNNDIGGSGRLIKQGSGALYLAGSNTFGGFSVDHGELVFTGSSMITGANTVGGGVSDASLRVSGALANHTLDIGANGVLTVYNGGKVLASNDITVSDVTGVANIWVNSDAHIEAGAGGSGSFISNGRVNLIANPEIDGGPLQPINVGVDSGVISGTGYHAYGGTFDTGTGEFLVSEKTGVIINPLAESGGVSNFDGDGARLYFNFETGVHELIATFGSDVGEIDFEAMLLNPGRIEDNVVIGAYDFEATPGDFGAFLSFLIPEGYDELLIWHMAEGSSEWELFAPEMSQEFEGWLTFYADDFSSYAVTVPEPGAVWLALACALGVVALRRRRR